MKKMLIAMTAVMFATTSAFAATTTFGQWANDTANKINQKEAAVAKSISDKKEAYKKQQAAAEAKREAQKKELEAQKDAYKKEAAAREAEQKAKQEAAKKKIETKKQQWKQLISE